MLRNSLLFRATEFASSTKSGMRYPRSTYGMTYLFNGRKRRFWTRSVFIETTDKKRAVLFKRHERIIGEINKEKSVEIDNNFDVNDLRTDDSRRVFFTCPKCGDTYRRTMKGRVHYQKGCRHYCDSEQVNALLLSRSEVPSLKALAAESKHPSKQQSASATVASAAAGTSFKKVTATVLERLQLFSDKGNKEKLAESTAIWSAGKFNIKCADCDTVFETYLRAVTGAARPGSVSLQDMADVQNRCMCCRHKLLMAKARENMLDEKGYYGGLNFA